MNKIFIDTNIWLYAFIETEHKTAISKELINKDNIVISIQVINEVTYNLIKKLKFSNELIAEMIKDFYVKYEVTNYSR